MPIGGEEFEAHRPLLFGIAYRMLGSASEAEDIVQEAYLRAAVAADARSPRALLATIVTRLCLDQLKSARSAREQYIGPWLPEPILHAPGGEELAERDELVDMAALLLMERLSPLERAVFVLHTAFEFPFEEIGAMLARSAAACRQAHHRARGHLQAARPRYSAPPDRQRELASRFLAAARDGDIAQLVALLSPEAALVSDGGGVVSAATRPVRGALAVARMMAGLAARAAGMSVAPAWLNGAPGLLVWEGGQLTSALVFTCGPGAVEAIGVVRTPAKLAHLAARAAPPG